MAGLYKILVKKGNSYQVELPKSIKIHPIVSPDRLWKAANNPLPGQVNEPPLPIMVTNNEE
jgi:hypothetical protein